MAHLALYREWRPKTFDEMVEQKQAVHALRQSVINKQIAHAYLFSGTRGTGKTTLAKIFSRAINCLNPQNGNPCNVCDICRPALDGQLMDIVEMDAASNNSVDNIRRLCDEVIFMPAQAAFKVYIIDEVHMLSTGAFNALLKTLEEPPAHAVFILATTEPHRIPATILSRCQRYEFRRIPVDSMVTHLQAIVEKDQISIQDEALRTIAILADGALRDAISILDQARSAYADCITHDQILGLVGVVRDQFLQDTAQALIEHDGLALLQRVDELVLSGRDIPRFVTDLAQYLRNVLVCSVSDPNAPENLLIRVNSETLSGMKCLAEHVTAQRLIDLIRGLSSLLPDLRWAADNRTVLEIGLIRIADAIAASDQVSRDEKKDVPEKPSSETENQQKIDQTKPLESNQTVDSEVKRMNGEPVPPETEDVIDPVTQPVFDAVAEIEDPIQIDKNDSRQEDNSGKTSVQVPDDIAAEETAVDIDQVWPRVLSTLQEYGYMTLYLFSRPAKPVLTDKTLELFFQSDEHVHFQEMSKPESLKIVNDIMKKLTGQSYTIKTKMNGDVKKIHCSTEEAWIDKVRQSAGRLGIPVEEES